ncbi:MAG: PIN domain-containing protein [Nitrospirae bacterium]|nr:PIN domain-containing protein [Nitrospirota bacterium]
MYAHWEDSPKHDLAAGKLKELAGRDDPWGLPVFCVAEFLRVVTHPGILKEPRTHDQATEALGRLLQSPNVGVLLPGDRFLGLLGETIRKYEVRGNLVFDAQIVALCRESGVDSILTDDGDFHRFRELTVLKLE